MTQNIGWFEARLMEIVDDAVAGHICAVDIHADIMELVREIVPGKAKGFRGKFANNDVAYGWNSAIDAILDKLGGE